MRIEKLLVMLLRSIWRFSLLKQTFLTYKKSLNKEITLASKNKFLNFFNEYIEPYKMTKKELRAYGKNENVLAVICGSDQIWSATSVYIDPLYYLSYFPKEKRVAYAPSFGKKAIPNYNKKVIKNYLKEINYLSVREIEGQNIIRNLINKEVEVLIDPTLLLNKEEWKEVYETRRIIAEKYILFYFLDEPSQNMLKKLKKIVDNYNEKIIVIPNVIKQITKISENVSTVDSGPLEFLNLLFNAEFVCTDSFHGMLFSINFNKKFYIFERNYGIVSKQSGRITSILEILKLKNRFVNEDTELNVNLEINWEKVNIELEKQRVKSKKYLLSCLKEIGEKNAK